MCHIGQLVAIVLTSATRRSQLAAYAAVNASSLNGWASFVGNRNATHLFPLFSPVCTHFVGPTTTQLLGAVFSMLHILALWCVSLARMHKNASLVLMRMGCKHITISRCRLTCGSFCMLSRLHRGTVGNELPAAVHSAEC